MEPKMTLKVVVENYYEVIDCYNYTRCFDDYKRAVEYFNYVKAEQKVISYLKPKGATLVVSKNPNVFYKCYPGFIGFNGVPFCDCTKDKGRPYFYNGLNSVERYSHIHGSVIEVLQKTYKLLDGVRSFDRRDGAYHYHWNTEVGNSSCIMPTSSATVWENHYWYNWDGENFTTNDLDCLVTSRDFK